MATLQTTALNLPDEILDPWLKKVQHGSSVAALSGRIPMKFGKGHAMTFDIGEAEYVGEGANKGASTIAPAVVTTAPFKFHKTVRWTDEVKYADEDDQLQAISQILDLIAPSLARALDFGVYHGINPTGGAAVAAMTQKLSATTNRVEIASGTKPYAYIDAADALVLADNFVPRDIALDPALAGPFATARAVQTEQRLYPGFKLTTEVSELENHRASVSRTVGAVGVAASATKIQGFVGDLSTVGWGIQRAIGLEMIEFGDPDGGGDLKRNNQVAFRSEVIYGWGIADLNAVAVIEDATAG